MNKNQPILYLGENGFPFRMASVNRQKYIALGLVEQGHKVIVLCRKGVHSKDDKRLENIAPKGVFEGIHYEYCSGTIYRPLGFFNRNYQKLNGFIQEFLSINRHLRKENVGSLLITTFSFYQLVYYKFLAKVFGVKIILDVVEYSSQMDVRKGFFVRINDLFYEKYGYRMMDGICVISDLLKEYIKSRSPKIPVLKIPVIFNYERINPSDKNTRVRNYQLFCGSANYLNTIRFILDAFKLVNEQDFKLKMVINGYPEQLDVINKWITDHPKGKQIEVLSNLSDEELYMEYNNATALLIPLLNRKQDIARFPQKVSEYLATANPVLSTPVGEIKNYFEHEKTAILAKEVTPISFAEIMTYADKNKEIAQKVGEMGRNLGMETFNYKKIGANLSEFIQELII
jgi:glycosyltransferase involved in cell wall biosynthesis